MEEINDAEAGLQTRRATYGLDVSQEGADDDLLPAPGTMGQIVQETRRGQRIRKGNMQQ